MCILLQFKFLKNIFKKISMHNNALVFFQRAEKETDNLRAILEATENEFL